MQIAFAAALTILPFLSGIAAAIPVSVTAPGLDEIYRNNDPVLDVIGWEDVDQISECKGNGGAVGAPTFHLCTSRARLFIDLLAGDNAEFKKSFDAWNATNAAASKWTLNNGGALPGGKFIVSTFRALAKQKKGGLEIDMAWDYAGADRTDFYWSQGLFTNYDPGAGGIGAEHHSMDGFPKGTYPLPLYPFQRDSGTFTDRHFYDKPMGFWPNAFFDAEVFLSKVDRTARTLTVYEGLSYGFKLSAQPNPPPPLPEPPTIGLLLAGVIGFAVIKRRFFVRCIGWSRSYAAI